MCSGDDVERASRSDCWPFPLQFSSAIKETVSSSRLIADRSQLIARRWARVRRRDLEPPPRCRMPTLRA